jgi:hypothetical protein
MPAKGKLLLRKHKPHMSGTKASGYTRAPDCGRCARVGSPAMGTMKIRVRRFFDDLGLSEWQKAVRDAAREGHPIPPPPAEVHNYRTCRDEYCGREACRAYREGLEDGHTDY